MPIVRTSDSLILEDSAVSLARYAQIIGYSECAFFGVKPLESQGFTCRIIWTLDQRRMVAKYLQEAQGELEDVLGYPLSPRWFANEQHDYRCPVFAKWGEVIGAGVRAETVIDEGATVNYLDGLDNLEPAEVTVATSVTDPDEIHVYHPGTDAEIFPSGITIEAGVATIQIPRCRLVATARVDNPPEGWEYEDATIYEETVDVRRVYNDPSTNAVLVSPHSCSSGGGCACSCQEYTHAACMYVHNKRLGIIEAKAATYSEEDGWRSSGASCFRSYSLVRLNYRAGLTTLPFQMEDAIVRLAHSKMPVEPCGCDPAVLLWKRDRAAPEAYTRERLNNPFGTNEGAFIAYRWAMSKRIVRGHGTEQRVTIGGAT